MVWNTETYSLDPSSNGEHKPGISSNISLSCITLNDSGSQKQFSDGSTVEDPKHEDSDFKVPTRKVIIEPAMTMFYLFYMASISLSNQYIYYAIGERHNLSAILDAERGEGNGTEGSEGSCGHPGQNQNSTGYHVQQTVQAVTSRYNLYMSLVTDIPSFIIILFFGRLMDQLGRRPALMAPLTGMLLRAGLFLLQQLLGFPLELLLLGGLGEALTGGWGTFVTACYAYYSDTIPEERRSRRLALADVVYGLATAGMNVAMGYMIEGWGFTWPFVVVIAGHCLNLTYVVFSVPESRQRTSGWKDISPRYVIDAFKVLPKRRPQNGRKLLLIFVLAWNILGLAMGGGGGPHMLYRLNSPFCWTPSMLGIFSSVSSLVTNVVQMVIALFLLKPLGELNVLILALVSYIADCVVTATATKSWMLWMGPVVGCAVAISPPIMRSVLSMLVEPGEQGALYSSLSAMDKITGIMASFLYNFIYAETLYFYKGTVFLLMGTFGLLTIIDVVIYKSARKGTSSAAIENATSLPLDSSKENNDVTKF